MIIGVLRTFYVYRLLKSDRVVEPNIRHTIKRKGIYNLVRSEENSNSSQVTLTNTKSVSDPSWTLKPRADKIYKQPLRQS